MREIKFRGWDEKNKEMVYNINLLFSNRLNDCFEEYEECGLKIMQYTGLKDINGVEIYEGDIHEYDGRHFDVKFGYYTDDDTHVEMYGWYLDSNSLEEQGSLGVDSEKYVNIIGNVYENPELLKDREKNYVKF